MAEEEIGVAKVHDLTSILVSSARDYVVRNNGDQVKVDSLKGKKVGLYFSASWCGPCQRFTPKLVEVYNELIPKGEFEVVFISADEDSESFDEYFAKMPWLAVPFSDSKTRDRLDELFGVRGIPYLVIIDENGKVLTDIGVKIIREYGAEGYPFTSERIEIIKDQEEEAKRNQSLRSILVSPSRDYVMTADGKKVPVTEFEGKIVGLYFSLSTFHESIEFTKKLVQVYENLKENRHNFEIVMVPFDEDEESFNLALKDMPWYVLPFKDMQCQKLMGYFGVFVLPFLVIIGPDGKTLHPNAAEAIEDYGVQAFPFTPERFIELEEMDKAKREAQTLESILTSGEQDYVIGKSGAKIPVSDLVGKNILLYFAAHWSAGCHFFLSVLIKAYNEIKAKDDAFEVIFISSDKDQTSFDEFFSKMPWLAIPFDDERKQSLSQTFKVKDIPMAVAIGPTGKTVTKESRDLIWYRGAETYPFTEERLEELEAQYKEMAKGWPKNLKHPLHQEHYLSLLRDDIYTCDGCDKEGKIWSYNCEECDFHLHPMCALDQNKEAKGDNDTDADQEPKEGLVCDGDVCYKA